MQREQRLRLLVGSFLLLLAPACASETSPPVQDAGGEHTIATDLDPQSSDLGRGLPWIKGFGGSKTDHGEAVAIDAHGHSYVLGTFKEDVDLGDGLVTSAGKEDIFLVSYDPRGSLRWVKHFGGSATDLGLGVAVSKDTVVIVGSFDSPRLDIDTAHLANRGKEDIFVADFDLGGHLRWAKGFGGKDEDRATAVAIDHQGHVAITGFFVEKADLGGETLTSSGPFDMNIFLAAYDASGSLRWAKGFGNGFYDHGRAVAFDATGRLLLTGDFSFQIDLGGGPLSGVDKADIFVACFDGDGGFRWAKHFGSAGHDSAYGLATDPKGNIAIAGHYGKDITFGKETLSPRGTYDAFLAHLTSSGDVDWVRSISSSAPDRAYGVDLDAAGNVYFTGSFQETATFDGGDLTSSGKADVYLLSYDSAGSSRWSRRLGGIGYDQGKGVAVAPSGDIIVTGYFSETIDDGAAEKMSASGGHDVFVWHLAP